jgi:hypothetical protein
VTVGARLGLDRLGAWFAAQLRERHPVQDRVHPAVAAGVVAVADGLAGPLGGRGRQRRGAVKRANPPSVKRRTLPTSTSSSATKRVLRPHSSPSVEPLACTSELSCWQTAFSSASSLAIWARWLSSSLSRSAVGAS